MVSRSLEGKRNQKGLTKDFLFVLLSNIVSLLVGLGSSFFIPKILQVDSYATYKLFVLYSSYVGFFHFGFVDGIYLRFGGCDYGDLDKKTFRTFFRFFLCLELLVSLILCSFILTKQVDPLVLLLVAIELLIANCNTYFSTIAQITTRFKTVSFGSFLLSVFKLICILAFLKLSKISASFANPYLYISFFLGAECIELFFYIFQFKSLVFGSGVSLRSIRKEILTLFKIGIPLLLANILTIVMFDSNAQIVSLAFDKTTFAVYSFSYNIFSVVSTFASAISLVLFPVLKRLSSDSLVQKYPQFLKKLSILFSFFLCFFPLISLFVQWFLPNYSGSVETIRICLPAIIIYNLLLILVHNYYKALGKEFTYTILFGISAFLGIGIEIIAYFLYKTIYGVSIAYFVAYCLSYLVLTFYVSRKLLHQHLLRSSFFLFSNFLGYFLITRFVGNYWECFAFLLFSFLVCCFLFYFSDVKIILFTIWRYIQRLFLKFRVLFSKYIFCHVLAGEAAYRILLPILFIACLSYGVFSVDLSEYNASNRTYEEIQNEGTLFCEISSFSSASSSFDYSVSQRLAYNNSKSIKAFYYFDSCLASSPSQANETSCFLVGSAIAQENAIAYFSLSFLYDETTDEINRSSIWISEKLGQSILASENKPKSELHSLIGETIILKHRGDSEQSGFVVSNILSEKQESPLFKEYSGDFGIINFFTKSTLNPDSFSFFFEDSCSIQEANAVVNYLFSNYSGFHIVEKNSPGTSDSFVLSDAISLKTFFSNRNKTLSLMCFAFSGFIALYYSWVLAHRLSRVQFLEVKNRSFFYSSFIFLVFCVAYFSVAYTVKIADCFVFLNPWCLFLLIFSLLLYNINFLIPWRSKH